ncbi:MAG: hypothetical protein NT027_00600, partial [Proteobacteria bacterium]|nr:hypothetical protein [Pseudomonadota bacterium]
SKKPPQESDDIQAVFASPKEKKSSKKDSKKELPNANKAQKKPKKSDNNKKSLEKEGKFNIDKTEKSKKKPKTNTKPVKKPTNKK